MKELAFHLSVFDHNAPRVYVQTIHIFPFPDIVQHLNAVKSLSKGLQITLTGLPFLAGTVQSAGNRPGKLSLRYPAIVPNVQSSGVFAYHYLSEKLYPYSYEDLERSKMPPSAFTGSVFCPRVLRNHPGIPQDAEGLVDSQHAVPALVAEAFFFSGGLALSIYFHHSVMDGMAFSQFLQYFAQNVYHGTHERIPPVSPFPNQLTLRKDFDLSIPIFQSLRKSECYGRTVYRKTLPDGVPCVARIFAIPCAKVDAIRSKMMRYAQKNVKITRCNVLMALIWIHVTWARQKRLLEHSYQTTSLGIAVDLRKRMSPLVDPSYMGVMALFTKATSKICDFVADEKGVTTQTVFSTVESIIDSISCVNNDWVQREAAFSKNSSSVANSECSLRFDRGPDLYITSWLDIGLECRWNIPGVTAARSEFVRRAHSPSDGGVIIYPRRREIVDGLEAPYEVLVRLASEDMVRLLGEENGFKDLAEMIIE